MNTQALTDIALAALHLAFVGSVALRVIWVRRPAGSAFAWLLLVAMVPLGGVVLYLLFGERPIGRQRLRRAHAFYAAFPEVVTPLWQPDVADVRKLPPPLRGIAQLAHTAAGMPVGAAPLATLAFNVGIAAVLLAVLAAAALIARGLPAAPPVATRVAAYGIGILAACWCFERLAA